MEVTLSGLPTRVIDTGAPPNAPLVVAMHGIGSNEDDLAPAFRSLAGQAVLAFVRSPLPHPPGYAWYRLIRIGVPDPQSFAQAQEALGAFLGELRRLPGLADRPLVLAGFSPGALLSHAYALAHPGEVAGVMAFSGYVPPSALDGATVAQAAAPRVFLAHGRRDQLFPFARLAETARELEGVGIRPTTAEHEGGHEIPPGAIEAARAWLAREFPAGGGP